MGRPSHVRNAVAELLASSSRHGWSIEEIATAISDRGVAADFSSVFRAVSRLVGDGTLARVDLGDGKARFEQSGAHHEHVQCDVCGAVGEIPGCLVSATIPAVERQTGFSVSGHRLVFSGLCSACAPKAAA